MKRSSTILTWNVWVAILFRDKELDYPVCPNALPLLLDAEQCYCLLVGSQCISRVRNFTISYVLQSEEECSDIYLCTLDHSASQQQCQCVPLWQHDEVECNCIHPNMMDCSLVH